MRKSRKRKNGEEAVRPRLRQPHLLSCVHQTRRDSPAQQQKVRVPKPRLRTRFTGEKRHAAALKLLWSWRELFLSESSPPRRVRIVMTLDKVHPAQGAAIVEVETDESGGNL